jgi:hypothetical protein
MENLSQGSRRDSQYTHYQDTHTLQKTHTHTFLLQLTQKNKIFNIDMHQGSAFLYCCLKKTFTEIYCEVQETVAHTADTGCNLFTSHRLQVKYL